VRSRFTAGPAAEERALPEALVKAAFVDELEAPGFCTRFGIASRCYVAGGGNLTSSSLDPLDGVERLDQGWRILERRRV
jgi:hypothetical protein